MKCERRMAKRMDMELKSGYIIHGEKAEFRATTYQAINSTAMAEFCFSDRWILQREILLSLILLILYVSLSLFCLFSFSFSFPSSAVPFPSNLPTLAGCGFQPVAFFVYVRQTDIP